MRRLPVGEPTPVSEVDLALMRRLHELMSPPEYAVHFKRLFRLAAEFGVRLLLDLHGLPGSQNGEMHSGMRESSNKSTYARAERAHFASDANWKLGWRTVEAMVSLCASLQTTPHLRDVLWGVQITNENNPLCMCRGLKSYLFWKFTQSLFSSKSHSLISLIVSATPIAGWKPNCLMYSYERQRVNALISLDRGKVHSSSI